MGKETRLAAQSALTSLPRKDAARHYPASLSDAVSLVNAREDAKRKQAANKAAKAKYKSLTGDLQRAEGQYPGAVEGGGDPGAFWMYVEDYFRDATQEDLHDILPLLRDPSEDSCFKVCPPGSGSRLPKKGLLSQKRKRSPSPSPLASPQKPEQSPLTPVSVEGTEDKQGRRSSRLMSRMKRGSEVPRYTEDDDPDSLADVLDTYGGDEDPADFSASPLCPGFQDRFHRASFPLGSAKESSRFWDLVSAQKVALFVTKLEELKRAVDMEAGPDLDGDLMQTSRKQVQNGKQLIEGKDRDKLIQWLAQTRDAISSELGGCDVEVPVLGVRRGNIDDQKRRDALGEREKDHAVFEHEKGAQSTSSLANRMPQALVPFSGSIHPYFGQMLQMKVPHHVRRSAAEAPQIDMNAAPSLGKSVGSAGFFNFALSESDRANYGSTAGTPTVSALGSGAGACSAGSGRGTSRKRTSSPAVRSGEQSQREHHAGLAMMSGGGDQADSSGPGTLGDGSELLLKEEEEEEIHQSPHRNAISTRGFRRNGSTLGHPPEVLSPPMKAQIIPLHPVACAVSDFIEEGNIESDASEQFDLAFSKPKILAAAPQDEITAETLALQAELAVVSVANRARLVCALRGLLEDLPRQRAAASVRSEEEQEIKSWIDEARKVTEQELKQRREAAHREALASVGLGGMGAPRPVLGGGSALTPTEDGRVVAPYLGPEDLYDVLAQRREDEESFCAVCGDGTSIEPNVIVFCDRCDVAVHQHCYDLKEVPESEWLCWPCREYEEALRAEGVPQAEIRPPGALPEDRRRLPGGSREAKCALCPIKGGAFRRTMDGAQWVHTACACWQDGPWLVPSMTAEAVDGLSKIPPKRWTTQCDICGKVDGAVINCKHPGSCSYAFHVLCARNCGLYLTVRLDQQGRPLHRIYCAVHSPAQKERDARAAEMALEGQTKALEKLQREEERRVALADLTAREEQLSGLRSIRTNMEQCRLLLDQCKRRERLKRQLAVISSDLYKTRLNNPVKSLSLLEQIEKYQSIGMSPEEQLAALEAQTAGAKKSNEQGDDTNDIEHVEDGEEFKWQLEMQHGEEQAADDGSSRPCHFTFKDIRPRSDAVRCPTSLASRPRRTAAVRRNYEDMIAYSTENAESPTKHGLPPAAADSDVSLGRRHRRTNATGFNGSGPSSLRESREADPMGSPLGAVIEDRNGHQVSSFVLHDGDLSSLPLKRQQLMSRAEAEAWNQKLPPGVRYVLVDQLPGSFKHESNVQWKGPGGDSSSEKESRANREKSEAHSGVATRTSARLRQNR